MSTAFPRIEPPPNGLTPKELNYIRLRLTGVSKVKAARQAGFPQWMWQSPGREIEDATPVGEILTEMQQALTEHSVNQSLINAAEIHEYLTDCIRADMRDIRNADGSFKPQDEWPPIWGRMMEAGDVEVETLSQRSHDGQTKDKDGGWDESGTVTKVKLKFSRRNELVKLAMQHKAVDAFVQPSAPALNVAGDVIIKWGGDAPAEVIDVTPKAVVAKKK